MIDTQFNKHIKVFHSDGAHEYVTSSMQNIFKSQATIALNENIDKFLNLLNKSLVLHLFPNIIIDTFSCCTYYYYNVCYLVWHITTLTSFKSFF